MGKIIYLPLEHIDSRYTTHMDRDITSYLEKSDLHCIKIYPDIPAPKSMKAGSFLDAEFTIRFKAAQLEEVARLYRDDVIVSGDIIWSSDLWHPGLPESIAYMNYFTKKDVKLRGLIHAGSFTDTDFVRDMERWAKNFEDTLFDIADRIYCGSNFIKQDIIKKRLINPDKLVPTGFPLDTLELDKIKKTKKEDIVIFSARNVDEKQPWLFTQMRDTLGDNNIQFINTLEHNFSKQEYYELLAKSKVVVSFALQENFGFSVAEAAYLGCVPVLPNRLVYPEFYPKKYLYNTFDEACKMVSDNVYGNNNIIKNPNDFQDSIERWFND